MRTVNVRLLGFLLLFILVVSATAYGVHGYQVQRNAGVLLREAKSAKERKDLNQAIDYLQRYVTLVPHGNVEPLADLGLMQADLRRVSEAYRTLESVLRQDPKRSDVRRRLVDMALAMRRFPDARHHLEILLAEPTADVQLLAELASCEAAMDERSQAAETLRKAIEKSPDTPQFYGQLADLMRGPLEDPLGALAVLDDLVEKNPESALAFVVRGSYWLEHAQEIQRVLDAKRQPNREKQAESENTATQDARTSELAEDDIDPLEIALKDARSALARDGDHEAVLVFAILCLVARNELEEARPLAQRAIDLYPKNPFVYGSLAELELRNGDRPAAIKWFERGLKALPEQQDLMWNLADALIDDGRLAEAKSKLLRLKALGYPRPPLAYLEAKILVEQKAWFEASHQFEAMRSALLEWPEIAKRADLRLGECYQQLGRNDLQLIAYRRAAGVDSRWIPARLGVANALLASGRVDEALGEYQQIAGLPSAPASILVQLARLTVLVNLRRNPSQRDWSVPRQLIDRLESFDATNSVVPILRAEMLVSQGENQQAEEILLAARDAAPNSIELWLGLVSLAEFQEDDAKARRLLEDAKHAIGDTVPLRLAEARHLVSRLREEAPEGLKRLAVPPESFSETDKIDLYAGLAGWTLAIGDFDETERLCTIVADEQPTNLRVRLLLFDLAYRAGKMATMERILDQLHQIERSGPLWHYGTAVRLAVLARENEQPELYVQAKEHLNEARRARESWSRIPVLLGLINDAVGDEDAAIINFTEAISLGERSPNIVSRAVTLLYQRRRFEAADQLLRNLQEQQSPFSMELTQLATEVSLRLNDRERALSLVTKTALTSQEPAEHIWAGRVLSALGESEQAEQQFRRAIELDESDSAAWVALIQHLGRTVQLEKAEAALAEATQKIPPGEAPLALAQALESIGRLEEAETQYQAALEAAPDEIPLLRRLADFRMRQQKPREAEPLLLQVLSDGRATDDDRTWCRRNLTVVLLTRPTPANLKLALEYVTANLERDPRSAPDRRAKALVLANLSDASATKEATEILEDVLQASSTDTDNGSAESRFVLARLYAAVKNDAKASEHMGKLLGTHGDEPRYLTFYMQFLISRNEIGEAELWQKNLTKVAGQDFQTVSLAAEIHFARQQYAQLLKDLDLDLAKYSGTALERQARARQTAFALEVFARRLEPTADTATEASSASADWAKRYLARADDLLKQMVESQPQETLALSAYYARNDRFTESLDLLEKALPTARVEDIAAVSATLISAGTASAADLTRAESLLRQALEKHGAKVALVLALGDHLNWAGQFPEAEQLYREALRQSPDNVAALNNLSVLLALEGKRGEDPLKLIQRAISLAGTLPALIDSRGTIFLALGDVVRAGDDFRMAISLRPTRGSYFRLAIVELQQGKVDAARKSLAKATELGLRMEQLHPLERPLFRQLQASLK